MTTGLNLSDTDLPALPDLPHIPDRAEYNDLPDQQLRDRLSDLPNPPD